MTAADAPPRVLSFSRRLAAVTLAWTLALALLVTAVQLAFAYDREFGATQRRLQSLETTAVPALATRLWTMDDDGVRESIDTIARVPGVAGVRLEPADGRVRTLGADVAPGSRVIVFPLEHEEFDRRFELGVLRIAMGDDAILAGLGAQLRTIALTTFVVLGGCWALLMALLRRDVTAHLARIAAYVRTTDVAALDRPLQLERTRRGPPDEFDAVVEALNRLRENLNAELARRAAYEAELQRHRDQLEEQVRERTSDLQQRTDELAAQSRAMKALAETDFLTGLANRRAFYAEADARLAGVRGTEGPCGVLLLDIDHFKRVNDTHGHDAGDAVIQRIAACCRDAAGVEGLAGRLGGEEFGVLLPRTPLVRAEAVAEALREAVERQAVVSGGVTMRCTVSIGVAAASRFDSDVDRWLKRADDALYAAKHGGRNRVSLHDPVQAMPGAAGARGGVARS